MIDAARVQKTKLRKPRYIYILPSRLCRCVDSPDQCNCLNLSNSREQCRTYKSTAASFYFLGSAKTVAGASELPALGKRNASMGIIALFIAIGNSRRTTINGVGEL